MKLSERLELTRRSQEQAVDPDSCYAAYLRRHFPMRYLMLRSQRVMEHDRNCRCMDNPNPCAGGLPG